MVDVGVIILDHFRLSHVKFPFFCRSEWKYWQIHMVPFNQFCKLLVISRHKLVFSFLVGLMGVGTRILLLLFSLNVPLLSSGGEAVAGDKPKGCAIFFLFLLTDQAFRVS